MIRLSLEYPTTHVKRFTKLTDFDFVLAHKVLEDKSYARYLANRERSRMLLLDNSMHELGQPLPVKDLARAASACRATFVVAPDKLGEPQKNLEWFEETYTELYAKHRLAVTLAGHTADEREKYLHTVRHRAEMICLPFREPRWDWFLEQKKNLNWCFRIHLFGVSELAELRNFAEQSRTPGNRWSFSVDTTKPIKWGMKGQLLSDLKSLRGSEYDASTGGNKTAESVQNLQVISPEQMLVIEKNIQLLREACM